MKTFRQFLRNIGRRLQWLPSVSIYQAQGTPLLDASFEIFSSNQIPFKVNGDVFRYDFLSKNVYIMNDVIVWPHLSMVATPSGEVIRETAFSSYRLEKMLNANAFRTNTEITIDRICTSIDSGVWSNYYHTLVDMWPRIYALRLLKTHVKIALLISRDLHDYEQQLADALLPSNVELVRVPSGAKVRAKQYIWLPYLSGEGVGFLPNDCLCWYRESVFNYFGLNDVSRRLSHRIYISRKFAEKRHYSNEAELITELSKRGFEVLYLENIPFREQVTWFLGTRVVFARHGAGLANLLFANSPATVVEHFSGEPSNHFSILCAGLGLKYTRLVSPNYEKNAVIDAPIELILESIDTFLD